MTGLIPFNRKNALTSDFSDFFTALDDLWGTSWPLRRGPSNDTFKLDVEDTDTDYKIFAELPGVAKEEIGLDLSEGRLTISIKREETTNEEKRNYLHRERRVSSMARSVYLADANPENVAAKLEDGVLGVTVAKKDKTLRTTKIDIM